MMDGKMGRYAFLAGLALAVVAGLLFSGASWATWVLVVLGLIVGFMNVAGDEANSFLIAAIALTISVSALQALPLIGDLATAILANVVTFISPAILVVALKAVMAAAQD